jgi:hypothetical protein
MSNVNLSLEEKQEKEYDDKVVDYFFTCEGAGVQSDNSQNLGVTKLGIKLHFYRYGLFHNNTKGSSQIEPLVKSHHQGQESSSIEENKPTVAPDVEGFYYAKTQLRAGYLYILDEENPNLPYEFEVNKLGGLIPVHWANNKDAEGNYKDIRKSTGKVVFDKTFKQGTVLWIAYSSVQWSIDYYDIMCTNTQRRAERMVKVVCSGFERGAVSEVESFTPFDSTFGIFPVEQKYQGLWFNDKIKEIIADDNSVLEKDPQALKEDMFICLHDPTGCILDVYNELAAKNLELKALVEAIQTGETVKKAKERILLKQTFQPQKDDQDHFMLFTLANSCYKFVFGEPENIIKYDGQLPEFNLNGSRYIHPDLKAGSMGITGPDDGFKAGVDKAKLEGILGVEERKKLRNEILNLRNALGNLFKNKYCYRVLDDYIHNCDDNKSSGHKSLSAVFLELCATPYEIERVLLLKSEYVADDCWQNWIYNEISKVDKFLKLGTSNSESSEQDPIVEEMKSKTANYTSVSTLTALLSSEYDTDKLFENKANLANKVFGIAHLDGVIRLKRIIKTRMSLGREVKDITQIRKFTFDEIGVRNFNKGKTKYRVTSKKLSLLMGNENLELNFNTLERNGGKYWIIDVKKEGIKVSGSGNKTTIDIPAKVNRNIDLSDWDIKCNNFNRKIANFSTGLGFNSFMGLVSLANLYETTKGIDLSFDDSGKSVVSFLGASADLAEVGINIRAAYLSTQELSTFSLEIYSRVFGGVGAGATSLVCFMDASDAFDVRDNDAGVAYIGAGLSYGVVAACAFVGAAAAPVAFVGAIIGMGFFILACSSTDSKLEAYFKSFLLSDLINFPKLATDSPMEYCQKILDNKKVLMDKDVLADDPDLANPHGALVRLYDLLICTHITCSPHKDATDYKTVKVLKSLGANSTAGSLFKIVDANIYYRYTMRAAFMGFINDKSQLDYTVYLFPKGIFHPDASTNREEIPKVNNSYNILTLEHGYQQAVMHFTIPGVLRNKVESDSQLLFALRVESGGDNSMEYPLAFNEKERSLGILLGISELNSAKDEITREVEIKPIDELLKPTTWKKKPANNTRCLFIKQTN